MNNIAGQIKKFFITNKKDVLYVSCLFIIMCVLMLLYGVKLGALLIDSGREAYLPAEILKGKVLYKDLFNIFGPLPYQLNAFLYWIFGVNLKTLFFAGFVNANLIAALLYFITELFTSKRNSFFIVLFCVFVCFFTPSVNNYIFPYTYAMTYALSAFFFSILFLLKYLRTSKENFLTLSWFFIGIILASKYEFLLYILLLFILTTFILKPSKKCIFTSLAAVLSVPVLCFSILFLQGLTVQDFMNNLDYVKKYSTSPSLNLFYYYVTGFYIKPKNTLFIVANFVRMSLIFSILCASSYFYFKNKNIIGLLIFSLTFMFIRFNLYNAFCWLTLAVFCIFIFMYSNISKSEKSLGLKEILSTKNGTYALLILISLLYSVKVFFFLNLICYGPYFFPPLFICLSIFLLEYLPKYLTFFDKDLYQKSFIISLLAFLACFAFLYFYSFSTETSVSTSKGTIYDDKNLINVTEKMTNYIQKNVKNNESIWVIPEGVMINFLTNHPTVQDNYINTTPPYIETFGEEKIITDVKKNPPDYILLINRECLEYGYKYMCEDYAFKICSYIHANYAPVVEYKTDKRYIAWFKKSGVYNLKWVVTLYKRK